LGCFSGFRGLCFKGEGSVSFVSPPLHTHTPNTQTTNEGVAFFGCFFMVFKGNRVFQLLRPLSTRTTHKQTKQNQNPKPQNNQTCRLQKSVTKLAAALRAADQAAFPVSLPMLDANIGYVRAPNRGGGGGLCHNPLLSIDCHDKQTNKRTNTQKSNTARSSAGWPTRTTSSATSCPG
jgi:hypothetical protein